MIRLPIPFAIAAISISLCAALADDWPMWRFDANRSAASPAELPAELRLQWSRKYAPRTPVWDDPLNHDLMPYDQIFEPVVLGQRMFVAFNDADKVVALDTNSGEELWVFYTDGPVRLAPVAWQNQVFFSSDDGCLYSVDAATGQLKWKFRGGPSDRKVLGNGRVISAWPARGGPVVRDGRVYFAASIWPFMGIFICALDAENGNVVWENDGTGSQFIKQPHSAPAFGGVAPQGSLVATKDILLVPGGRSVPAAFDRETGEFLYFHLNEGGKGSGGSFVAANETEFYVHTRLEGVRPFDLKSGSGTIFTNAEPVLDGALLYSAAETKQGKLIRAVDTSLPVAVELEATGIVPALSGLKFLWEIQADASHDLIKAGNRLYAAGADSLTAIELPEDGGSPRIAWSQPLPGEVRRLLAADGKLFAVTLDGRILAFGGKANATPSTPSSQPIALKISNTKVAQAKTILRRAGTDEGYALWFGVDDSELLEALVSQSLLRIVAVDPDAERVERLRRRLDAAGLYGERVTVHQGDPLTFQAPPYFANLVVIGESAAGQLRRRAALQAAFSSVRPYGGVLWTPIADAAQSEFVRNVQSARLEKAAAHTAPGELWVVREGALPGAADWTHQYGDIANTLKSDDSRVKAPLGLLWFGGNSNMDILPRHGHGPPEQVIGGRMFVEGLNSISARDVYTGRQLWKTEFPNLGTFGIYYNETYTNTPLSTAYNQKHIAGANGRGPNLIATEDAVYVAVRDSCQVLDAATGQPRKTISLTAKPGQSEPPDWGYIGVYENLLLAGDGFAHYPQKFSSFEKKAAATIEDYSASDGLAAFDRHSGQLLWRIPARHSFIHNGVVAGNGRVYCIDRLPPSAEDKLKRRGASQPMDYRVVAFDAQTGRRLWEDSQKIFGSWLGYSKEYDVLLFAGAAASDRLKDEADRGMRAYRGRDGTVLWENLERKYTGPCILHHDLILTSANSYQPSSGAFNLLNGTPHLIPNPLTGELEPWRISRTYGCNNIIASENLLTFRSGAAGFYDLISKSGTANLGGFKSGCTANLVVANGVLNAPDFTRTCTCAYQNQTSLALIHVPEIEMWTYSQFGFDAKDGERIERVGINFGAPGDRRAEDGTLWLEYPPVGGDSPGLTVTVAGRETRYFRRHVAAADGTELPWVAASGVRDCESITITPEILRPKINKPAATKDDEEDSNGTTTRSAATNSTSGAGTNANAKAESPKPASAPRSPPALYTVRLHFVEPDGLAPGRRVFNIALQGRPVLESFDIAKAAAGGPPCVIKEFNGVTIETHLNIALARAVGSRAGPVVSGIELIAEQNAAGD